MVRLSIVTPSLNQGAFVARAADSVASGARRPVQHIVVDGGSTDGTLAALAGRPIEVHSCPGLDSHQAINHGIGLADGDVIGVLNTDDYYEPDALDEIIAFFEANPEAEAVCAGMRFFRDNGDGETQVSRRGHLAGDDMMLELTFGAPGFNSWFFRRRAMDRLHGLDVRWRFSADRDFLLRLFRLTRPAVLDRLVYHYRVHGQSRTLRPDGANRRAIAAEHVGLAQSHLPVWASDPAAARILTAWWSLEWVKLKILGGTAAGEGARPPLWALLRAWALRRRLRRLLP